jgi:hypothetical protein
MADYTADVEAGAANRGRRMAWLICDICAEAKRRRSDPVGSIFDSPKGPFFEATVWQIPLLRDKDTTGRRQKPGRGLSLALLDVPPDARRDGIGNYRLLNAGCPRHGELSIDEAALHEAVSAYRESFGWVRAVLLAATRSTTSAQR